MVLGHNKTCRVWYFFDKFDLVIIFDCFIQYQKLHDVSSFKYIFVLIDFFEFFIKIMPSSFVSTNRPPTSIYRINF